MEDCARVATGGDMKAETKKRRSRSGKEQRASYPLMTDRVAEKAGGKRKQNVTKNNVKIIERCLRKNRKTGRE